MAPNLIELLGAIEKAKELFPDITKDGDLQQVVKAQITAEYVLPALPQAPVEQLALAPSDVTTVKSLDDYKDFVFAEDHFKSKYGHAPAQSANFYKAVKNMFIQQFKQAPFQHRKPLNAFRSADIYHYPLEWLDEAFETLQVTTPAHWKVV